MRKAARLLLLLAILPAFASGEIVPTRDPGSDCVAAKIYADWTDRNRKYDEAYCSVNRDRAAYDRCLRNSSRDNDKAIAFFTDRCAAPDEGAYLSFNNKTHHVWREPGESHRYVRYAGTYKGKDVVVRIQPIKLIKRYVDESEPLEVRVRYEVDVYIQHGTEVAKISAVYDDQR